VKTRTRVLALIAMLVFVRDVAAQNRPLPSWNDSPRRDAILQFVESVTTPGSKSFVSVEERIAVFDNDGTLWCEQPMYVQLMFVFDRVKQLAPEHPEWKEKEPFKSAIAGDYSAALRSGEHGVMEMMAATHAGMTPAEFQQIVKNWLATAKHPRFHRPYTECVYQPMLEVLAYLREHEFKTYIVSGGGVEFMRPWAEPVYGIVPEQVIGSRIKLEWRPNPEHPTLFRLPEMDFVDDHAGKPIAIEEIIGRRPVMAFGNSDGDLEMLQYTVAGDGPRFVAIVHHTDAEREYAYDRKSPVGTLDKALTIAEERHWNLIDMKNDWSVVFPPEKSE
jgi:phosphoglycolate phosphatase-like HAD superfamily hydrolase